MIQSKADVMKYLPHREPFLFIDEVISLYEGDRIHARMHIKDNDIFLGFNASVFETLKENYDDKYEYILPEKLTLEP